jgi:hypothetical protein
MEHRFVALVVEVDGGPWSRRVELPEDVAAAFAADDVRRVVGTLSGHRFRRQLHGRGATPFVAFGKGWLRRHDVAAGEPLEVTIGADPDPDSVDLPDELATALEADPMVEHAWESLTPGRQRSLAFHVGRGVQAATRERRVARIVTDLRAADE